MCGDSGCAGLGVGSLDRRRNQNYRKATLKPDSCTDPILKCASEGGRQRAVIQMSDTNTENTVSLYPTLLSSVVLLHVEDINPRGCK